MTSIYATVVAVAYIEVISLTFRTVSSHFAQSQFAQWVRVRGLGVGLGVGVRDGVRVRVSIRVRGGVRG